jgi:hypothetical protein
MTEYPTLARDQAQEDGRHLRLLVILNFVAAGLCFAGIGFLFWHHRRMHDAFLEIGVPKNRKNGGIALEQFFDTFMLFYLFSGAVLTVIGAGNLLSGLCIRRRKYRIVSLLVACLNFILVPIGTVLGAFALVVLLRPSVRGAYEAGAARPAPPGGDLPGPTPGG